MKDLNIEDCSHQLNHEPLQLFCFASGGGGLVAAGMVASNKVLMILIIAEGLALVKSSKVYSVHQAFRKQG